MTRISDLSQDLIEEILSRVPLASKVRSTCKQWNSLYKDESFTKKHRGKAASDTMVIMVCNSRPCLVSVKLQGVHNQKYGLVELSSKLIGKLNRIKGFSLKGNTYFVAQGREEGLRESLICFDFTSERFRHCLDLESNYSKGDSVILSSVGEEQLAVLFHRVDTYEIEIRITTKIEADDVTWTSFLKIDVEPFESSGMFWKFLRYGIFYVDEKNKAALICDYHFSRAYVIGEDNYFKVVSLGESTGSPVVCSYVPSSMQIQKGQVHAGAKRKVRDY
ncbi:hypothetical protein DY000_02049852 [Brassica cretica]|uniref:F-box domain-containing protein n=1 Tax=Brassica cretica TaxID=69181 RepID=A0ABQ7ETG1_BRACR|nr:hypothetical protein DY000_02049852 [Brassica cretica]